MNISPFYKNILGIIIVFALWYLSSRYICYKNGYFRMRFEKKVSCNEQYMKILLLFIVVMSILFYIKSG
jgi:hypothetical protein